MLPPMSSAMAAYTTMITALLRPSIPASFGVAVPRFLHATYSASAR